MLHSRYIVVADYPDGSTEGVYNGADSVEAQKAMAQVIKKSEAQAVLLFSHPMHSQVRYPLQEELDRKNNAARTEELKNAGIIAKKNSAIAKREQAKQLSAEAKRLEAEAAADHKESEKTDE